MTESIKLQLESMYDTKLSTSLVETMIDIMLAEDIYSLFDKKDLEFATHVLLGEFFTPYYQQKDIYILERFIEKYGYILIDNFDKFEELLEIFEQYLPKSPKEMIEDLKNEINSKTSV